VELQRHTDTQLSRDHLVRTAVPLYLGRVTSFATEMAELDTRDATERLKTLYLHFERSQNNLVTLWTTPTK
jgi:hypothetical protein